MPVVDPHEHLPVIAMRGLTPGQDRQTVTLPHGLTVREIVQAVFPGLPEDRLSAVRVILVDGRGEMVVDPRTWSLVRPKPGVRIVLRLVPGKNFLQSILQIVVLIAAVALAAVLGPILAGAWPVLSAAQWGALVTAGVALVGNLLISALVPTRSTDKEKSRFTINSLQNSANPDGVIPAPLGKLRIAPVYASMPYSEIVDDQQYIRCLFIWGYGRLKISDLRLGDTPIGEFDEVEIESREGVEGDDPITLYPQQVIEEGLSVELTRARPRDDTGKYIDGATPIEKPVVRYTATDANEACVIIGFPAGLVKIDDEGERRQRQVDVRVRQRPVGSSIWSDVVTLQIKAATNEPFFRAHRWVLPARGTYEIELTRMSVESKDSQVSDRSMWQALQSFRPEYPLNFDKPLAVTALRIKATYQLQGNVDNFNGLVSRVLPDWDAETETWVERETRSPAAAYRYVLQGAPSAYPEPDASLDLEALADWSAWCADKGLHYDRDHADDMTLWDVLADVSAAGRATPRHDGRRWSVVIDRPSDIIVAHINARNSRDFRWTRSYLRRPDALRVPFIDATNDYKKGERLVPWPGHAGDIVVTEQLEHPGKTDPDEIWIETRRRQYEIEHRADQYQVTQDGAAVIATRGDLVAVSADTLARLQVAGRVKSVVGRLIEIDETVEMVEGQNYAIRFRVYEDEDDDIGTSVVRTLLTVPGRSSAFTASGSGQLPEVGALVHFGVAGSIDLLCRVRAEERGDDMSTILHLVDAAPVIDELTDAEVPPAWDGRVGSTIGSVDAVPAAPTIRRILSGLTGTGIANGITVFLKAGAGPAIIGSFVVARRLYTSGVPGAWSQTTCTAAEAGASFVGDTAGQVVGIKAHAVSIYGTPGPDSAEVLYTVGSELSIVPSLAAFDVSYLDVGAWRYSWTIDTSGDGYATAKGVRIRARSGVWTTWDDLQDVFTDLLTASPTLTDLPLSDGGTYTFGAAIQTLDGRLSNPIIVQRVGVAAGDVIGIGGGNVLGVGDGRLIGVGK